MLARKPIDKAIDQADESLKAKLILSKELRAFSVAELGLPSSKSYRTYVALKREFPVWTVVAAPEFSLRAEQWCYPVIGCASYRGYFKESSAVAYASKLQSKGLETDVGGASAYSTLGWFADPLLPSMMKYGDTQFAETLFHEIAHQKLYINGDSDFNEAFASVVGEVGVLRWLKAHRPEELLNYEASLKVQEQFYALVSSAKKKLQTLYSSGVAESQMRPAKASIWRELKSNYEQLRAKQWNGKTWYQSWFEGQVNNAKFVSLSTYRDRVPELRALLSACGDSLPKFYEVLSSLKATNQGNKSAIKRVIVPKECDEII